MSDGPNPIVQRRRLRTELRKARAEAELTQEQVAARMDWSLSKVIRIESGEVGISTNDLKMLLDLYAIDDEDHVAELAALARSRRRPGRERPWWNQYRNDVSGKLLEFIEYEDAASAIRGFQSLLVPGLLQTPEYARQVLAQFVPHATPDHLRRLVDIRLRRQEILEQSDPPSVRHIIDEMVVRRIVGAPEVVRGQLEHMVSVASRPNVTLQVVPFRAGLHPAMQASFVILEFPDAPDGGILYMEGPRGEFLTRHQTDEIELQEVKTYTESFHQLCKLALSPTDSAKFLGNMAGRMEPSLT
jgi:transcriptional regulator with XRE-family HTH domain